MFYSSQISFCLFFLLQSLVICGVESRHNCSCSSFFILKRNLALDFQEIHLFRPNIMVDCNVHFLISQCAFRMGRTHLSLVRKTWMNEESDQLFLPMQFKWQSLHMNRPYLLSHQLSPSQGKDLHEMQTTFSNVISLPFLIQRVICRECYLYLALLCNCGICLCLIYGIHIQRFMVSYFAF